MNTDPATALGAVPESIVAHVRHLSEAIGSRGSCTPGERQAAEYAADQLRGLEAADVTIESFEAIRSTYWPYALAFIDALIGSSVALLTGASQRRSPRSQSGD